MNRAWEYYQLVRMYGDVQWIDKVIDPADSGKFPSAPGVASHSASSLRVTEEDTPMHHRLPPSVAMKVR